MLGSAALLRQALVQAAHHARHRQAFGKPLAEQPLMRNVLADLALESEASMALALRLARAVDDAPTPARAALARVGTPAAKLWVCKRAVAAVAECLEAWGGNGYVEDGPMPRLYRETPVNSVWEGSGNVMALDVLRALQRERGHARAGARAGRAAGQYRDYDAALAQWRASLADPAQAEVQARRIAAGLARLWQAALLIQHAPAAVADAFVGSRLAAGGGIFGEFRRRRCPRHPRARAGRTPSHAKFPTSPYRLTHLERHAFSKNSSRPPTRPGSLNRSPARTPSSAWAPAPPPTSSSTGWRFKAASPARWPARNAAPPAWRGMA